MDQNYIDYGKVMNTRTFRICIQEMFNMNLPQYFKGMAPPRPMLNGVEVSAEEYNSHAGITYEASDELVAHDPIQVGSEEDMVISYATPASIVDMCINGITFDIPDDKDLDTIIDIMYNYKQQISPFTDKAPVQQYIGQLSQAILILVNNQNRRKDREDRIHAINGDHTAPKSLGDMLQGFF